MRISTKGRYALHLMIDLAEHNDGSLISLRDIAARQDISVKYLEQIVALLSKPGFLKSGRGPQGGYRLARKPEEYTIGSILRLTEGNLAPVSCLEDQENHCDYRTECATLDFWSGLYQVINQYIDRFTLADLVKNEQKHASSAAVEKGQHS